MVNWKCGVCVGHAGHLKELVTGFIWNLTAAPQL